MRSRKDNTSSIRPLNSAECQVASARRSIIENFSAQDFKLPLEELPDGRLSHIEETLQNQQARRIKNAKNFVSGERKTVRTLERRSVEGVNDDLGNSLSKTLNNGGSLNIGTYKRGDQALRKDRIIKSGLQELSYMKQVVGKDYHKMADLSRKTIKDFEDESTMDFPKLGSLEEKYEDLRAEGIEVFCAKHGKTPAARFVNKDKRMLRKWFQELDADRSGEVSVQELQDPMLSAGIFKTIPQIFRVMLNADANDTLGLDFEEFLNALYKNQSIDVTKLKKLQAMGADEHGFNMETLITAERRVKLLNSIVGQMEKRQTEFRVVLGRMTDASRKMEVFKYTEREREREKQIQLKKDREAREARDAAAGSRRESKGLAESLSTTGTTAANVAIADNAERELRKQQRALALERQKINSALVEAKNVMKWLVINHEGDKKLHGQYVDSLDSVLKLKREGEDVRLESRMVKMRMELGEGGGGNEDSNAITGIGVGGEEKEGELVNAIHADRVQHHDKPVFEMYKRKTKSMYGNGTRRIYMPTLIPGEEHLHPSFKEMAHR